MARRVFGTSVIALLAVLATVLLASGAPLAAQGVGGKGPEPPLPAEPTTPAHAQPPLTGVAQVTVGRAHACARLTNGTARCWGSNSSGQLGDDTTAMSLRPVVVKGPDGAGALSGITQIAAGGATTCARLADGTASCWGSNAHGQLGDGTVVDRHLPTTVQNSTGTGPFTDIAKLAVGQAFVCASKTDGQGRCWGDNSHGQLGDGTVVERHLPVSVLGTTGDAPLQVIVEIAAGEGTSACARLASREARCWGSNDHGQLGDSTVMEAHRAVKVLNAAGTGPLVDVSRITVGAAHACARAGIAAVCWGDNSTGGLGDASTVERHLPVTVHNASDTGQLTGVTQLSAGNGSTCARLAGNRAVCWGDRFGGELGDGLGAAANPKPVPSFVLDAAGAGPLDLVVQLEAGFSGTCFRSTAGTAGCTGVGSSGQLGSGRDVASATPVDVTA